VRAYSAIVFIILLLTVLLFWLLGITYQLSVRQRINLCILERKLDALLRHHAIEVASPLSAEVQRLARDPRRKIAAIKLHRQQNAGLSLAKAKREVEEFTREP
jgi:hypothetical protein